MRSLWYYTDEPGLEDEKMGCAFPLATTGEIVKGGRFRLTDGLTVFVTEIQVIKETISDALRKGLRELDIL